MKRSIRLALVLITFAPFALAEKNPPLEVSLDPRRIAPVEGGPLVTYADVLGRATPSVVAVYTAQIVTTWQSQQLSDIFRYFGRPVPLPDSQDIARERKEPLGVGSGVIISEDGYIITNYHVVQGMRGREADEIKVQLGDGTEYEATLIGWDAKTDVAVLKIEVEEPLPAVSLADSDRLRVGDVVFAIGNPLDVGLTATQGIVSAMGRHQGGRILGPDSYEDFIQTDAAINLGNSGGALIDAWGRLVGINTAIVSGSGGSIGIGFAIPVNLVINVASNLIESGEVPRGMLGLFPSDLTRDMADAFGLDSIRGALVNQVQDDSPASRAGIRHGDIILLVNETEIDSAAKLRLAVSQILPGTEVDVTLIRRGERLVVPVTLGSLHGGPVSTDRKTSPLDGVRLRVLDSELRVAFSIPDWIEGVVITQVAGDSPFVEKLERLMVILEVNGESVESVEDIEASLVEGAQNHFYVWSGGTKRFVILRL
jgi:serine protease Do/serine protease DegQ